MKTTNTTTTTNHALTMEELKAIHREQTKQAFIDFIKANKNKDNYFNNLYSHILYQEAEKAVHIALRARHSKSGLQFLADLQNAQSTDNQARNNDIIAESLTYHESKHESFLKGYEFFNSQSQRLTLTNEERITALTLAQEFSNKAQAEKQHINSLYDSLDITLSDRADLTQTAIIKLIEVEKTPVEISQNVLASYGATTTEELTKEEREQAQSTSNFRAVINSVGRAISQLTSPDANNRHTTKAEPITVEQVTDYILKYGNDVLNGLKIPHTTRRATASQCYITIEERNTKTQKGFYKVTHYKTVQPYQYIEDILPTDENGESDIQYIKVDNPIQHKQADIESIEELLYKAFKNCTEREREQYKMLCMHYLSATRYYTTQADIISYIANREKTTTRTIYNRLNKIKSLLEPFAKNLHIIK